MITRALAALKEVFIPKSEIDEEELECSVDDTSIDCEDLQENYENNIRVSRNTISGVDL